MFRVRNARQSSVRWCTAVYSTNSPPWPATPCRCTEPSIPSSSSSSLLTRSATASNFSTCGSPCSQKSHPAFSAISCQYSTLLPLKPQNFGWPGRRGSLPSPAYPALRIKTSQVDSRAWSCSRLRLYLTSIQYILVPFSVSNVPIEREFQR